MKTIKIKCTDPKFAQLRIDAVKKLLEIYPVDSSDMEEMFNEMIDEYVENNPDLEISVNELAFDIGCFTEEDNLFWSGVTFSDNDNGTMLLPEHRGLPTRVFKPSKRLRKATGY